MEIMDSSSQHPQFNALSPDVWERLDQSMSDPTEWSRLVHEIYNIQQHSKGWVTFGVNVLSGGIQAFTNAAMSTLRPRATKRTALDMDRDTSDDHEFPHIREAMQQAGHMSDEDFFRMLNVTQTAAMFSRSATKLCDLALEWLLSGVAKFAKKLAEHTSGEQARAWKEQRAAARDRELSAYLDNKLRELRIKINEASTTKGAR